MKSKEELNALKKEVETLNKKLAELTEEELAQVSGGDTEENLCPRNLEKTDSQCVVRSTKYICPYAKDNGSKYVCLLGKGMILPGSYQELAQVSDGLVSGLGPGFELPGDGTWISIE